MCKSSGWVDTGQVKLSLIILMMMMRFDDALLYSTDRTMLWCFFSPWTLQFTYLHYLAEDTFCSIIYLPL